MNTGNRNGITKVCLIIGFVIIIIGLAFVFGLGEEKKVHRLTKQFEWEGKPGFIILKFTSNGGTFTTGEIITVKPTLGFELTGTDDDPMFFLNLPNSMNSTEYKRLTSLDDELTVEVTQHSFTYQIPISMAYYRVFPGILAQEFDTVWTLEGNQDGKLAIIHPNPQKNKEIDLSNLITIESSETRLQLRASQQANGLAVIVLGLSIITAIPSVLSLNKRNSDKSKPSTED